MKLLVMQFSPPSRHSIPLRSIDSPQYPVLKHPQSLCGRRTLVFWDTVTVESLKIPSGTLYRVALVKTDPEDGSDMFSETSQPKKINEEWRLQGCYAAWLL
jgi:hypothetical protein